jgi:hypothetical protein
MKSIYLCLLILATIFAITLQSSLQLPESRELSQEIKESLLRFLADDPKKEDDKKKEDGDTPAPSTWDTLFKGFMDITNNWKRVVDAFKSGNSQEIIEKLKGEGFEHFSQDAQVQIITGVRDEYFDKLLENVAKRIKVPEGRKEDVEGALETARFGDTQVWSAFNTLYDIDAGGNVKFASVLISRSVKDGKDVFDVVFSDLKSTFKLAPDITVVEKKLVVAGGIWSQNEFVYQKTPRTFKPEDIEVVMSFFQIVTFKCFANHFGIKMEFPKFQ